MQQIGSLIALVALVAAGAFLIGGTDAGAPKTPTFETVSVPFVVLSQGVQSDVSKRVNYLITSEEGLKELWKMIETENKMPSIDFSSKSVVAVFAGEKNSGGHDISISKIEDSSVRTVVVTLTTPGEGCMTTQAITSPYQVVEVPNTELTFAHTDTVSATNCN